MCIKSSVYGDLLNDLIMLPVSFVSLVFKSDYFYFSDNLSFQMLVEVKIFLYGI